MKYTKQLLINNIKQGHQFEFLMFWGHQPSKDGKITASCLSQWWICSFEEEGAKYTSAEQYMMAGKARLFNDSEILEKILNTQSPKEVKALGRKVRNFDDKTWKENRYEIVKNANLLKFGQNADLKDFLISTGNKIIVEASPYDRIWGIGMGKEHQDAQDPEKWKGANLLGFSLVEVREQLRK